MENKAKILIAIPNLGNIHPLLVMRLLRWSTMPTKGVGQVSIFMPTGKIPHDSARNFCTMHFLNTDNTHLFFIDNDVIPPEDALEKLVEADKDIVSGLYAALKPSDEVEGEVVKKWCVFNYGNDKKGDYGLLSLEDGVGLVPIRRAGTGCLLIKRKVIEAMPEKSWFRFQYHENGIMYYGEDIDFCAKAEAKGFELWAHFDVKCRHWKNIML